MLELISNARERKESKKSAQTAKQHSRNDSEKQRNENDNTVCTHKNATNVEKSQGKNRTTQKNYFERKTNLGETAKALNNTDI